MKTSNGNFMMHGIRGLFTQLTFSFRPSSCLFFGGTPSTSTGISSPSRPSGMIGLTQMFRLPLSHTGIITECFFSMKIACRSYNIFPAKVALFYDFIGRLATLVTPLMIANRGTVKPILALERLKRFAAGRAYFLDTVIFIFKSWHRDIVTFFANKIKTIEIEEKYCQIAVKRLSQGVLPL